MLLGKGPLLGDGPEMTVLVGMRAGIAKAMGVFWVQATSFFVPRWIWGRENGSNSYEAFIENGSL
ncbi:MAG: hypothetical protein CM15mP46_4950 [Alphaproteobacteria bacterium]|nr:MAG: hypothetical protein CM15mP46_4950 [Alphaproteobacteria bacterium]